MEGDRIGRVVAVALLALFGPVACAAFGVGTPSASGLPPPPGSATPAVQSEDGEEAPTSELFFETTSTVRHTGPWAAPVSHRPGRHASDARVRVPVFFVNEVAGQQTTGVTPLEPAYAGPTTTTALGPAASTPEVTPVALAPYLRLR